jgi:hypothetical protein
VSVYLFSKKAFVGNGLDIFNIITLYSEHDCNIDTTTNEFTGSLDTTECYAINNPAGCRIVADKNTSYGDAFNEGNFANAHLLG